MNEPGRALISVFDKTGVVGLAAGLVELGWKLIASGGTARAIAAAGLPVVDAADHTGSPTMLGHRVVTLHPRIHGGILADRDDPAHQADLEANGIDPIDLVVVNLYPFEASPGISTIDIGGPAMVRAAAKNHAHVGVVVDPDDYPAVLDELRGSGRLSAATRRDLARRAFAHTAAYEAAIAGWFDAGNEPDEPGLPAVIRLELKRAETLRYGENPYQQGARYRARQTPGFFDAIVQHGGQALSYLNLMDAEAAWRLAHDLGDRPAAVIVKHANPCGAAVANELATAYSRAFDCDPRSAFGGVVATNTVIDQVTADAMVVAAQADVVIAPGFAGGVVDRLAARRANTRLLEAPEDRIDEPPWELRTLGGLAGEFLVQTPRRLETDPDGWQVVTARQPTDTERADAVFAWRVCAHTSSNAVVLARDRTAWGIGAGQQSRVEAGQIAAAKSRGRAAGGACASDGFYPFADGIHAAVEAGAAVVVQPGGSVNDAAVIAAADERNIAMLFTGERQFRH
ncbi:MAG: bifunctional phosphoribosylaminoimidazolecarboxamide formyltransferase/IMP cyclohydrolase [Acidimicrobiaceae bacterium]|nr:bifunctional phosphoribosylaminoimidazolecarboxamide formyltransferase/IMP cyclohydrolase [Acidimicrobiaceae bacterium]MDE0514916.1 bifunctional phosphoribosylaminoimidazolecarboxamide formyltransferase/IMP cyclohydrolase [Acidimicrobiaceae bacterium]MDE0657167.1 bifunctional phosphoribosylaminoimidazolecarboxamide formyltransferase/IMP cyclohydrolase [Acidimicrobiaceae bacterium]